MAIRLREMGTAIITILFSRRPLVTDAITNSDALIATWLADTQGGGIIEDVRRINLGRIFDVRNICRIHAGSEYSGQL